MKTFTNLVGLVSLVVGFISVLVGTLNSNIAVISGGGLFMALSIAISVCNKNFHEK